jgi:hypothetical protein
VKLTACDKRESGGGKVRQERGLCPAGGADILAAKIDSERRWLYGGLQQNTFGNRKV